MNIYSRGAQRNRGVKHVLKVSLKSGTGRTHLKGWTQWGRDVDNARWDATQKTIVISEPWVEARDGITHHDYTVHLSLEDVSAIVAILGDAAAASDAELLRDHLGKQVPALVKLLACATGLVPTPMAERKKPATEKTKTA